MVERIPYQFEKENRLELWLDEIRRNWQDIPEFEVEPVRFGHLAIICDGSRRAASIQGLSPYFGHRAGVEVIKGILQASRKWNIRTLTFWTWSTENWEREKEQVEFVMNLALEELQNDEVIDELLENQVRFVHLGRKDRLFPSLKRAIEDLERKTVDFNRYQVNLAMDYGGLDEVGRAINRMFEAYKEMGFNPEMLIKRWGLILKF